MSTKLRCGTPNSVLLARTYNKTNYMSGRCKETYNNVIGFGIFFSSPFVIAHSVSTSFTLCVSSVPHIPAMCCAQNDRFSECEKWTNMVVYFRFADCKLILEITDDYYKNTYIRCDGGPPTFANFFFDVIVRLDLDSLLCINYFCLSAVSQKYACVVISYMLSAR